MQQSQNQLIPLYHMQNGHVIGNINESLRSRLSEGQNVQIRQTRVP